MAAKKVFILSSIPRSGIGLLREKGYTVDSYEGPAPIPETVIKERVAEADALIPLLSDTINEEIIEAAAKLKIIANYAVGFNNIDLEAARKRGITVSNTPDILTPATADLTWALILSVSKRISEGDRFMRAGRFKGWGPQLLLGGDVTGKTLGIIGAGRIGRAVAKRAKGFDMRVVYFSRHRNEEIEQEAGASFLPLNGLLQEADFISLHVPLIKETHHLLNAERFKQIKKGAYLINTARGAVVDEAALVDALQSGRLAGAGLDVYEFEPRVTPALLKMEQVVLLPHIGSGTTETREEMSRICARNIIEVLEGREAITPVF